MVNSIKIVENKREDRAMICRSWLLHQFWDLEVIRLGWNLFALVALPIFLLAGTAPDIPLIGRLNVWHANWCLYVAEAIVNTVVYFIRER